MFFHKTLSKINTIQNENVGIRMTLKILVAGNTGKSHWNKMLDPESTFGSMIVFPGDRIWPHLG